MISRFLFSFVFAYRNIMRYKLRSVLFVLSFIALLSALMLALSLRGFVREYYYHDLENTYRDINMIIKTSESANARYFSIRHLDDLEDDENLIENYASFFEVPTLIHHENQTSYVHVLLGSILDFKSISNTFDDVDLSLNEVIITKSLSSLHQLNTNDVIEIQILNQSYFYTVKSIVDDYGVFKGEKLFMSNEDNLSLIIKTQYPSLSNLPQSALRNLRNVVYLKYNDAYDFNEVSSFIKSISAYTNLNISPPYNLLKIESDINRSYALVSVVLWLIILAVVLVMQTTLIVYFNEKKKRIALIDLLGGKSLFSYWIIFIEFLFFFIISIILSIYLANFILKLGISFVGLNFEYIVTNSSIWISIFSTFSFFLILSFYYFLKFKKSSSIEEIKETVTKYKDNIYTLFIVLLLPIVLYFTVDFFASPIIASIIKMMVFIITLLVLPFLLIKLWIKLSIDKNHLRLYHLKIMVGAKSFKQYTFMLMISLISIFLLVLTNHHIQNKIDTLSSELKIDYMLTNFTTKYDDTYTNLKSMDGINQVSKSRFYRNINFTDLNHSIDLSISMDLNEMNDFFIFDQSDLNLDLYNDTLVPVIYLPYDFKYLYNISVGDFMTGKINDEYSQVQFLVGGFFQKTMGNLAITNLSLIEEYSNLGDRVLLIQSDDENIFQELIRELSPNFIYVIDYQLVLSRQSIFLSKTISYLNIIMSAIMLCFILGIINHSILLFDEMKKNYARLHIVGLPKIKIQKLILEEGFIYFILLLLTTFVSFFLLSNLLTQLIILTGAYENILVNIKTILISSFIVFILFLFVRILYVYRIDKLNSSSVLRLYE